MRALALVLTSLRSPPMAYPTYRHMHGSEEHQTQIDVTHEGDEIPPQNIVPLGHVDDI